MNNMALLALAFFAFSGYRKGLAAVLLGLFGLLLGYFMALKLALPLGDLLRFSGLSSGVAAYFLGGSIAFFGVGAVFAIPGWLLRRRAKRLRETGEDNVWAAIVAGVINMAVGLIYVLLMVWLIMMVRGSQLSDPSLIERMSSGFAERVAIWIQPDSDSHWTRTFAQNPGAVTAASKTIINHPGFGACLNDPQIRQYISRGDHAHIQAHPEFQRMINDPDVQDAARALGMEEDQGERLASWMALAGRALHQLQDDPEVQAILNDPEFQTKLKQSPWAVMNDERFLTLARKISALSPDQLETIDGDTKQATQEPSVIQAPEQRVYRWRDANGGIHITNHPPPAGAEEI